MQDLQKSEDSMVKAYFYLQVKYLVGAHGKTVEYARKVSTFHYFEKLHHFENSIKLGKWAEEKKCSLSLAKEKSSYIK